MVALAYMNHPFRRRLKNLLHCFMSEPLPPNGKDVKYVCCVCGFVWVSAGLWSKWLLNHHPILKYDRLLWVYLFCLSARGLQQCTVVQSQVTREFKSRGSCISVLSFYFVLYLKNWAISQLPSNSPSSCFSELSLSLLGFALPKSVWLSFTLSLFTPWMSSSPLFYLTPFKPLYHRHLCCSVMPQQLSLPHLQF